MLLKEFIAELQRLYDNEISDPEYLEIMGEPTIEIDVFRPHPEVPNAFIYKGFGNLVDIERSSDGVYMILNRFDKHENS